jgi:hypothetical protein
VSELPPPRNFFAPMPTAAAPAVATAMIFHGAFFAAFVAVFASCHSPHAFATEATVSRVLSFLDFFLETSGSLMDVPLRS